jgi:hypothetical protein
MKSRGIAAALAFGLLVAASGAAAQCQLANPSFEFDGPPGDFGGWNLLGNLKATSSNVVHGNRAVRLSGPNTGNWDISALWQTQASAPGDVWRVRGYVGHGADQPLNGNMAALINVEWRDAGDNLISFDTFTVADAATPTDQMQAVEVTSSPAPAGTVTTRILFGVLQSPAQEVGSAYFDLVAVDKLTGTLLEDVQWVDFPGGRTLEFAGYSWRVKGPGFYGPGPNSFSDEADNVYVDAAGHLHNTLKYETGTWYSTEVTSEEAFGYGDYRFQVEGRFDHWAPNVVYGLFTWLYPLCFDPANPWNLHNEADVEISRWGNPVDDVAQFVVQPYQAPGNLSRFPVDFTDGIETTSFAFRWLADRIEYRAWKGDLASEGDGNLIASWVYTGPHLPRPDQTRVHINLWYFGDSGPWDGLDHEAVLSDFVFVPDGAQNVPAAGVPLLVVLALMLLGAGVYLDRRRRAAIAGA